MHWRRPSGKFLAAGAGVLILLAGAGASSALWPFAELPAQASLGTAGRVAIRGAFRDSEIVVGTSARVAGAIDSLTWNGMEFINSYDHGRELQSASTFNNWAECFNPTEAGSQDDDTGPASSSRLLSLKIDGQSLTTQTRMAFWLAPGETSPSCPGMQAVNRDVLSDHVLIKTVTIGADGLPNVIKHDLTFRVPNDYDSAVFQALNAYMPAHFSAFWSFDPATGSIAPIAGRGELPLPVIIATPDGQYALGVYSPDLPQRSPRSGYGRVRFDTLEGPGNATVKWVCVFRKIPVKAGDHRFVCYSIVGTLEDVKASMAKLAARAPRSKP